MLLGCHLRPDGVRVHDGLDLRYVRREVRARDGLGPRHAHRVLCAHHVVRVAHHRCRCCHPRCARHALHVPCVRCVLLRAPRLGLQVWRCCRWLLGLRRCDHFGLHHDHRGCDLDVGHDRHGHPRYDHLQHEALRRVRHALGVHRVQGALCGGHDLRRLLGCVRCGHHHGRRDHRDHHGHWRFGHHGVRRDRLGFCRPKQAWL